MHEGSSKKPRKCIKNDLGKDWIDRPLWRKNHANGGECLKKNILEGDNKDLRRVVSITKKGYYGWRMTTLMARRRSAKRIS